MQIATQTIETIEIMTAEQVRAELRTIEEERQQTRAFLESIEATHPDTYWTEVPYREAMDFANYLNDVEMYLGARMEELTPCELVVSFR